MPGFEPFRLSKTIEVHSNDIRAVDFVGTDTVITTSRDGTAKLSGADGTVTTIVDGAAFLNAVAVSGDAKSVLVGSHDSTITRVEVTTGQQSFYLGHESNVSCLDTNGDMLASGSWDHTVRIWDSPEQSAVLKGHSQNVWDVKFIDATHVLTASADKTIKLWETSSQKLLHTFTGHSDVVRALLVLSPTTFLSASNDSTLRLWDIETGKTKSVWSGHTSFVYALAKAGDFVVSSGEDRTVRVWDTASGTLLQTILMPSISQWSVAGNALGDFVVGSSDSTARVFSQSPSRWASEKERNAFDEAVKSSAMGEHEVDESQISDATVLSRPGKQEGQVVIVRGSGHQLEAHQFSGGVWTKIGDVMGAGQSTGSKTASFNGKQYDYVFDVDIEDGAPPLKLPYNNSDNPYTVAETFIADNGLPSSYVDQVVQFIIRNSEAKKFGSVGSSPSSTHTSGASATGPAPATSAPKNGAAIVEYSKLVQIKAFQTQPLLNALNKAADERGDNLKPYDIESLLNSLPSSATSLLQVALELRAKWSDNLPQLLAVYDLLRIAIADAASIPYQAVLMQLLSALDPSVPKHALLATRGIVNILTRPDFDSKSGVQKSMLSQAVNMEQEVARSAPNSKPLTVALATLALNLAVLDVPGVDLSGLLRAVGPKVKETQDAESTYRYAVAVALRSASAPSEIGAVKREWLDNAPSDPRLDELLPKVRSRLH